jgi:vacuolar-type H+-ATPase subunit I/STV1
LGGLGDLGEEISGSGIGGGAAAAAVGDVAGALSDWEKLEQKLDDYFQDESLKLFEEWRHGVAVIEAEFGKSESDGKIKDPVRYRQEIQRLKEWYDREEAKLDERVRAKRLSDEKNYYDARKFLDANYYTWRIEQIETEVRRMDISAEQREELLKLKKAQLEEEKREWDTAQ